MTLCLWCAGPMQEGRKFCRTKCRTEFHSGKRDELGDALTKVLVVPGALKALIEATRDKPQERVHAPSQPSRVSGALCIVPEVKGAEGVE